MYRVIAGISIAAVLLGALATPALSMTAAPAAARGATIVKAVEGDLPSTWAWDPADVNIGAGERIVWANSTSAAHGVQAWDGAWDIIRPIDAGKSLAMRFRKPGVYSYRCPVNLHSDVLYIGTERVCVGMCGTITVR